MRWRGLTRSHGADLPIARPLTLINQSPGPETRLKYRFPDPSCVTRVSPGAVPVSGDKRISTPREKASTRGWAENLEIFCLSTRHPHNTRRYPPRRRIFHRLIHSHIHSYG